MARSNSTNRIKWVSNRDSLLSDANFQLSRLDLCPFIQEFWFAWATISQNSSFIHDFSASNKFKPNMRHSDRLNVSIGYAFSPLPPSFAHAPEKYVRFSFHLFRSFAWVFVFAFIFSFFIFVHSNQSQFGSILLRCRAFRIGEHKTTTKYFFFWRRRKKYRQQPNSLFAVFSAHV